MTRGEIYARAKRAPDDLVRRGVSFFRSRGMGQTVGLGFAESLGQRDAFISALDATFAAARSVNDRDLDRKHGK